MEAIDLERLEERLNRPSFRSCRSGLRHALQNADDFSQDRLSKHAWHRLAIKPGDIRNLHADTIRRLHHPRTEEKLLGPQAFRRIESGEPELLAILRRIRSATTGWQGGLRTRPCYSEAGSLRRTVRFPAPDRIANSLKGIDSARREGLLADRLWNAILQYLLLIRIHPFRDGNGRTMRAHLNYEFWRAGLIHARSLPLKRVLDANRHTEFSLAIASYRSALNADQQIDALLQQMSFMAQVVLVSAEHSAVRSPPQPAEGSTSRAK